VTMQVFVREHCTMIAAPVQCDVDGILKCDPFIGTALVFKENVNKSVSAALEIHAVKQVRKMLSQLFINERVFHNLRRAQIE